MGHYFCHLSLSKKNHNLSFTYKHVTWFHKVQFKDLDPSFLLKYSTTQLMEKAQETKKNGATHTRAFEERDTIRGRISMHTWRCHHWPCSCGHHQWLLHHWSWKPGQFNFNFFVNQIIIVIWCKVLWWWLCLWRHLESQITRYWKWSMNQKNCREFSVSRNGRFLRF